MLPAGESTKSFGELGPLCEKLLETGLERGDLVIALGGGVIGDLAGFAASILRRGVRFVQIPTSLLAQVDSSVGGKTGINTRQGKNLIGTFHQPSLVLADTDVLATLPPREMRAGYAEVAKYGLLGDASFFEWLEANHSGIFAGERMPLTTAIETSVKAKAAIVIRDEHENGDRALLNLGHTFGHALEAWTGYSDRLLHGEGVAIGMCLAFRFSEELGLCPKGTAEVIGYGLSGDAYHVTAPEETGDGGYRAMRGALQDSGLTPADIDYVNAHGTSTPLGDEIELRAVERAFGNSAGALSMSSTKSAIGHLLGAAGAVEAVFCVLSIRDGIVPPTLNLDAPSVETTIDLTPHTAKKRAIRAAMSNSFGFGGTNAALILATPR